MTHATVAASPTTAVVAPQPRVSDRSAFRLDRLHPDAAVALVLLACAWWLLVAPRLTGGRGPGAVTGGAILTAIATLAIQPQRLVPRVALGLAVVLSAAALAVALVAPTGWAGATTAASYVCVAWTVLTVAAAVVHDRRVINLLVLLLVAAVLVEIAESWLAWWGGADAGNPMVGTFYWWDPFAAFLLAGTVIGLSVWLRRTGPIALFGLFGCVFGTIGMVYSTSRAADMCFAVAAVSVCLAHLVGRGLSGARRIGAGLAVGAVSVWAIAGPPFFAHRVLPFAATRSRTTGQSLAQNGGYRLDFWREAVGVFHRHPLAGGGYHSLASAAVGHTPTGWPLSPLAHDGYLQALSDGGLLLAVPFLLGAAALAWYVVCAIYGALRRREFSTATFVVPLCLGALLAHSAVDFDWSFAADFALVAVLGGVVAGTRWSRRAEPSVSRRPRLLAGLVVVGVVLTGIAAVAARSGDSRQSLPLTHPTSTSPGSGPSAH